VARLTGRVVTVKRIKAGEGVSYGYIYRAERDGVIALVTGGYADGVPRSIGNHASALVNGRRVRVVGRVAMDVVVVVTDDVPARPGDEVVLLGDPAVGEPGLGEWASITGYDPVEIAASAGPRVARSYTR
jgi:alanine racemase